MAGPLILLTGVVLRRLCRLDKKTEDQQKSTENRYDDVSRTSRAKTTRFFDPGRELASILAPQKRSRVLSGAAPGVPGRFCRHSGRSWAAPETLPRRSRDAFRMLLSTTGRPERAPGSILSRFWVPRSCSRTIWDRCACRFSHRFRERAGQRMMSLSIVRHTSEVASARQSS